MTEQSSDLLQRWHDLLTEQPRLRARNAAARLGVSEGELLAARCGDGVARLDNQPHEILEAMIDVGQVLTITRNACAVHEKRGYYDNLKLGRNGGGTFDYNINMRYFFRHWGHAFAVTENDRSSLQFFDHDGTSVHKIYQTDNGDPQAWQAIVQRFTSADQSCGFEAATASSAYTPGAIEQADADAVRRQWLAMTDIHEFWPLVRDHKLRRIDALKVVNDASLARPVAADAWRGILEKAARTGLPVMIFTRNAGASQIHTGPIHKLVEHDGWFNVLDPTFNLHLRAEAVSQAWVVYKPTATGGQTSLELYHEDGQLISHIFGAVNLRAPEMRGWRAMLADLPTIEASADAC